MLRLMMKYTLIRSKRKTITIRITKEATVEVRAPLKAQKAHINRLVLSKEKWITEHLASRNMLLEQKASFALNYGDTVLYRGKEYPIAAKPGNRVGFDDTTFYMPDGLTAEQIKYTVIQIYKMLAKRDITSRVIHFSKLMNSSPTAVHINSAKTRWGSCSGKNRINFSWRLVLADDALIDYVVVHELAHIKEHNHSSRFWAVVESVLPDYKARQQGLITLQRRMAVEDWE